MKIDLIIGSLQSGGAERVVSKIGEYLANHNYQVRIITFRKEDAYSLDEKIERLRFHKNLLLFNYTLVRAFFHLLHFYRKEENRPDIINSHIDVMGLTTIPIAKLYKIKVIASEHMNHHSNKKTFPRLLLWDFWYKYADAITILTKFDLEYFSKRNKNVVVIPNPSSFLPIPKNNTNRENVVLAIGSLDRFHHKGFDNLLDIIHIIKSELNDWKFVVVGEGETGKDFLKEKIKHLDIEKYVIFTGFRNDIDELLRKSSIFILPSRFEGLPMALIEATSQGIACISYDCISGPSDILVHNETGLLIENQNKVQMAENLKKLLQNKALRVRLGDNAIESSKIFSLNKVGEKWEKLFAQVIQY